MRTLIVSRQFVDSLKRQQVAPLPPTTIIDRIYGIPFRIDPSMPVRRPVLVPSNGCRFIEFEPSDALWAVPCGLAKWANVGEEIHCVEVNI